MISTVINITPEQERLINLGRSIEIYMSPAPLINSSVTLIGLDKYAAYIKDIISNKHGLLVQIEQ